MFGILTAVAGAIGALYFLVKMKLPWLTSDLKLLRLLISFGSQIEKYKKTKTLPIDLFEKTADKYAEKTMIIFKDTEYSFKQIDQMANKVANVVLALGFKRGDTVAILMYNEPTFIWTWFGCEKIGVEVAFINFHQRKKTLLHSITISGAKAIFFSKGPELYAAIDDISSDLKNIDLYTFEPVDSAIPSKFKSLRKDIESAGYDRISREYREGITTTATNCLIFTSGTTGLPKAAVVTHLKCFAGGFLFGYCHVTSNDILYEPLPLYHSAASLLAIGTCRQYGAALVLSEKFSASYFFKDCNQHKVTMIHYVGEMCRYLVNSKQTKYDTDHCIKTALGNGLRKDVWVQFKDRFHIENIVEFYGATELPFGFVNIENKMGSVGKISPFLRKIFPVAFVKFDTEEDHPVRNKDGRCEQAVAGDAGLMILKTDEKLPFDGYKNKEEATKKRLLHDVFKSGDTYINSGDLFCFDEDYYYYFYDRLGDTFRWKGENVSTTEVANIISELPFISDACVYGVTIQGCEGRAGMVAITFADTDTKLSNQDMIAKIEEQSLNELAVYAIPRFVRFRQVLDITSTFKQQKTMLKKEGFDPNVIHEPLYYFDVKQQKYFILDKEVALKINNGEIKM